MLAVIRKATPMEALRIRDRVFKHYEGKYLQACTDWMDAINSGDTARIRKAEKAKAEAWSKVEENL